MQVCKLDVTLCCVHEDSCSISFPVSLCLFFISPLFTPTHHLIPFTIGALKLCTAVVCGRDCSHRFLDFSAFEAEKYIRVHASYDAHVRSPSSAHVQYIQKYWYCCCHTEKNTRHKANLDLHSLLYSSGGFEGRNERITKEQTPGSTALQLHKMIHAHKHFTTQVRQFVL